MEYIRLSELNAGETCEVIRLECTSPMKQRFMDLGLVRDTSVCCLISRGRNSIKAYSVGGSTIAIRKCDADQIIVRRVELQ